MSNQQNRVHLAIASPSEIEHTARHLTAVRDGFLTSGTLARYTLRSLIQESWLALSCHAGESCASYRTLRYDP